MAKMIIRTTNSSFQSISDELDFDSIDDAYAAAVREGLAIAVEEVLRGAPAAIVGIAIDLPDQDDVVRGAVSVSTAKLLSRTAG